MTELTDAIEDLYIAFADRELPEWLGHCTLCDTAEYEAALHAPLRTLSLALVGKYIWDAIHHTGTAEPLIR